MREIFAPRDPVDPGEVFYTITADDKGKRFIDTEVGVIHVGEFMGPVLPRDVGKRIIRRRLVTGPGRATGYIWQVESDRQLEQRRSQA